MKVIPYDIIAKQKLNKRQLQTGGITDYEKEIKMLQVLVLKSYIGMLII